MARPGGLGKGLSALIPNNDIQAGELAEVDIDEVFASPNQPRQLFNDDRLSELAVSIKENGVVQPIVVRKMGERFEIIAGERRWRASKIAGLTKIPVLIKAMSDSDAMKIALLENLQREDLNPIEEAEAYRRLIEEFKFTQESLAESLGKSRPTITNAIRVLSLPKEIRDMIQSELITMGHARCLITLNNTDDQLIIAHRIISDGLSVRDVERLTQKETNVSRGTSRRSNISKSPELTKVEEVLQSTLGTKVRIKSSKGDSVGRIEIEFFSQDELSRLVEILIPEGM